MASRARSIQRKSIHRFSTGPWSHALAVVPALAIFAALASAPVLGGCAGGGSGPPAPGDRTLTPVPDDTFLISPGATGLIRFLVTSGGIPLPGQLVTFTISDGVAAQGSTLTRSSAITDDEGIASVELRAGLPSQFRVQAMSEGAHEEVVVIVAMGGAGNVAVVPFFTSGEAAAAAIRIEVMLIDAKMCRDVPPSYEPGPGRPRIDLPMSGGTATFEKVSAVDPSAVLGRAMNASEVPIAAGCVDLAGASLLPNRTVQLLLPLDEVVPQPYGTFVVTSELALSPPLEAAERVAAPWRDLADCPLDPAELLLDCTIDALAPPAAGEPLDCRPTAGAGGALGEALTARRGALLLDGAHRPTRCRGSKDADNRIGLDAKVMGMFGSPLPSAVVALPAIADDATHLLDEIVLRSSLTLRLGLGPGQVALTHTLSQAQFGRAGAASAAGAAGAAGERLAVELAPLALPALTAEVVGRIDERRLAIEQHGFTLRLGITARAAFGLALERRSLPGDAAGLVAALATLARAADGTSAGCTAIDALLCREVNAAPGCLLAACLAGLDALAARLDAAFSVADGTGLDLQLAGTAPLIDTEGGGIATRLGDLSDSDDRSKAGVWSVDLRTGLGRRTFTAPFAGERSPQARARN